jgi:CDP-glycerol glycerophosphotransferase (TagB/SpsB family)
MLAVVKSALLSALSFVLALLVPRDPRLVVLGGRQYGGNTAPLFEAAHTVGLRAVWLSRDARALGQAAAAAARLGHGEAVPAASLRGVWLGARAGAVVFTHSLGDFAPVRFPSDRTRLLNVWHGMPIKRISTQDPKFAARKHAAGNLREMARYEAMFVTSAAMAELFRVTFGLPLDRIHRTGQPRTDVILAGSGAPLDLDARYTPALPPHRRKILYCPTWREGTPVRLFPFADADRAALNAALAELDAVMFVRTHPNDTGRLTARDDRLVPLQGDVLSEITDALSAFDALVTDYSSVYYDYLLLDRPTIFLPYDLAEYAEAPGFYLPFGQIAAGPCPDTQAAFIAALREALDTPGAHADRRAEVARLVYDFVDAGATARVLEIVKAGR